MGVLKSLMLRLLIFEYEREPLAKMENNVEVINI